jgi:PST family polysaccharide transporter
LKASGPKKNFALAGFWSLFQQFGSQLSFLIITIFLARTLTPEDYGLIGIVMLFVGVVSFFSEPGLIAYIVKEKNGACSEVTNSIFWFGLALSVLIYVVIYLTAPLISLFFGRDELTVLTRLVSISIVFNSLVFVPTALQQREMNFFLIGIVRILSILVSGCAALYYAYYIEASVYALVVYWLLLSIVNSFVLLVVLKWRPGWTYSRSVIRDVLNSTLGILNMNLVNYVNENVDKLVVSKIGTTEQFGLYSMAYRMSKYPVEKLRIAIFNFLLPLYSSSSQEKRPIEWAFYSSMLISIFSGVAVFAVFSAEFWVLAILGESWIGMVPLVQIISIYVALWAWSLSDSAIYVVLDELRFYNKSKLYILLFAILTSTVAYAWTGNVEIFTAAFFVALSFHVFVIKYDISTRLMSALTWRMEISSYLGSFVNILIMYIYGNFIYSSKDLATILGYIVLLAFVSVFIAISIKKDADRLRIRTVL